MRKSSRAISLALVGSGLVLSGCLGRTPEPEGNCALDTGRDQRSSGSCTGHSGGGGHSYGGGHGYWGGWRSYGGGGGARGAPGGGGRVAVSPRGGFGAAGHAAGGS
jgi:hypothetical protein